MDSESNRTCVRRHFEELWNKGKVESIDEFFSPDFTNFGLKYEDVRGKIQFIVGVWRTAFPDLHFVVDKLIEESDSVVAEVTLRGTHLGPFVLIPPLHGPTIPPNGKRFEVKHLHRFRLKEHRIIEHFAVRDDLGMFQQLGHLHALIE